MSAPFPSTKPESQNRPIANLLSMAASGFKAIVSSLPFVKADLLTGLVAQKRFRNESERIFSRLAESDRVCSLLLISIDNFSQWRAAVGHDAAYSSVGLAGRVLTRTLRPGDLIGRVGTAKFAMCLPDEVESDTRSLGERLCRVIEEAVREIGVKAECRYEVVTVEPAKTSFAVAMSKLQ